MPSGDAAVKQTRRKKDMHSRKRVEIYARTKQVALEHARAVPLAKASVKYNSLNVQKVARFDETVVEVWPQDTINAALELQSRGNTPLVLNFSDWNIPGGMVEFGYGTQEENLFRRSNYFLTLTEAFYPMRGHEVVYSPQVLVFRTDEQSGYQFMPTGRTMDFIANPAIRGPQRTGVRMTNQEQISLITDKIRMIFKVACLHGHDSLVLGAWGCGAFHNPPQHISRIFRTVIEEFRGCFQKIVFAILRDFDRREDNYEIFRRTFALN